MIGERVERTKIKRKFGNSFQKEVRKRKSLANESKFDTLQGKDF
jgi:hypothetical protein